MIFFSPLSPKIKTMIILCVPNWGVIEETKGIIPVLMILVCNWDYKILSIQL